MQNLSERREIVNLFRLIIGAGLFASSLWISPFIAESTGASDSLSFLMVGGILSFLGGMVFYSGVKASKCCCPY